MSITVYAGDNIDYVWSTDKNVEVSYTKYVYDANDTLLYTATGKTEVSVGIVVANLPVDISTLDDTNITNYLNEASMSLTVYAGDNVDYVWSTNKNLEVSYTKYIYDLDNETRLGCLSKHSLRLQDECQVSRLTHKHIQNQLWEKFQYH